MGIMEQVVYARNNPFIGRALREFMLIYGLDIPPAVRIGRNLTLQHRAMGTVIHPETRIGNNVTLYHQVTIGRADAHIPRDASPMASITIEDEAILYPGCKILGGAGETVIGYRSIVAANAVVIRSVPPGEVWAGIPARKVGVRHE